MYRVSIQTQSNGKQKSEEMRVFEVDAIDSPSYHEQMNAISDYLYELDIPFDVDEDGDMLIDDIVMALAEEETFEKIIREKRTAYIIKGEEV